LIPLWIIFYPACGSILDDLFVIIWAYLYRFFTMAVSRGWIIIIALCTTTLFWWMMNMILFSVFLPSLLLISSSFTWDERGLTTPFWWIDNIAWHVGYEGASPWFGYGTSTPDWIWPASTQSQFSPWVIIIWVWLSIVV